jgi:CelD/BcsL family acetyltransferase involved in cellulose biosynthesis
MPDLPAGQEIWKGLGHEAGNPFTTWEWASTWWRHFGAGREQRILGFHTGDGGLVAVLPLYIASRRPLRMLRLAGHGPADQLGPVCKPEHRDAVLAALPGALSEFGGWDICMLERLSTEPTWPDLAGGVVTRVESSPTIRIETTDWEKHLASRSSNFRSQTRRWERRLDREHELRFRLATNPERLGEDMDTFLRLHRERWTAAGTTAFSGKLSDFHRDLAALALENGWLRLCFLELDGTPRAATYCYRMGGADWFYQSGRDPDLDEERVGTILLNNNVREAVRDGMGEFKLLLGEHAYKNRLATDDAPAVTVALSRNRAVGAALRVTLGARRAGWRLLRRRGEKAQHGQA